MRPLSQFAQAAGYGCDEATDSAYGAGSFGTCASAASSDDGSQSSPQQTQTSTTQPGAPNTGEFIGLVTSGSLSILLPLALAVIIVAAASIAVSRKKRTTQRS